MTIFLHVTEVFNVPMVTSDRVCNGPARFLSLDEHRGDALIHSTNSVRHGRTFISGMLDDN